MENKVLATVAGEEITEAEFNAFLQNVPREQQAYLSNPAMRSHYLDQLIALHLFAKDGADQKLDETEEFKNMIANAKRDILAQMSMAEALKNVNVSDEQISTLYDDNKNKLKKGPCKTHPHRQRGQMQGDPGRDRERHQSLRGSCSGIFHLPLRPEGRRPGRVWQRPNGKRV